MSFTNLDLAIPIGAVDKVANLAKPPAETQEPITSSSAVPWSQERYTPFVWLTLPFCCILTLFMFVRVVTSRAC